MSTLIIIITEFLAATRIPIFFDIIHALNIWVTCNCLPLRKHQASGPPALRFPQIWYFSENFSLSHESVPPYISFLKLKLIFELFLQSEIFFFKQVCHQHFFSLGWGIISDIFFINSTDWWMLTSNKISTNFFYMVSHRSLIS